MDSIIDHRGPIIARQYRIRWKDYSSKYDTWEPRGNVHPALIHDHEIANGVYASGWRHRCDVCDLPCSSAKGVAIHKSRKHKQEKTQNFVGTLADEAVKTTKLELQQDLRPVIKCEGEELKNVFRFKYLGTIFTADAKQAHDINTRTAKAFTRCGELRNVFDVKAIPISLKLRLYQAVA